MATAVAQYVTGCSEDCGAPIEPGQDIETDDWDKWRHVHCPVAPAALADHAALTHPTCPRCGLLHPGEC